MRKSFLKLSFVWICTLFLLVSCGDDNSNKPEDSGNVVKIGLLVPLSGTGQSFGDGCKAAVESAISDYQKQLKAQDSEMELKLITYNTETRPEKALEQLKLLHADGVRFVIGPYSSSAAELCVEYANENDMYLFTVSTVANSLAKKDNLYRLVPNMKAQDKAIIKVISLGNLEVEGEISQTATIYRNDTWGKGLSDEINDFIGTSAGWFMPNEPIIGYDPTSYNVASIVKNVNDEMIAVRDGDGKTASAFGIMLISFAEGTEFLAAASKYDWLTQLMWYGASAYAQDPSLLERNSAAEFAYKTRFSCPIFALNIEDENKWGEVKEGIENATGKQANSYAILGYDAAMLACLCEASIFTNDTLANDVDALIRTTLSGYDCKTGTFVFDENGDRPEGNYDFWSIRKDAKTGEYKWIVTGTYYPETDQFSVTKEYFD